MFASTCTASTNVTSSKQSYKFFYSPLHLFRRTNLDFTSCSCENEREKEFCCCYVEKICNERIKRSRKHFDDGKILFIEELKCT